MDFWVFLDSVSKSNLSRSSVVVFRKRLLVPLDLVVSVYATDKSNSSPDDENSSCFIISNSLIPRSKFGISIVLVDVD